MEKQIKVDFHCHSNYSPDAINQLPQLLKLARERGLDRLVVTDHNRLDGALAAKEMDPELVIMGEEIMTTRGELCASFVKEKIPIVVSRVTAKTSCLTMAVLFPF